MRYPKIKSWVTYLEMATNPSLRDNDIDLKGLSLKLENNLSAEDYLSLYKDVGRHYIWNYRPSMSVEKVQEVISSPKTLIYYFYKEKTPIGFSEIDCSDGKNIEIVHFGLVQNYLNKGYGKELFKSVLKELWNKNPERVFLSTCGLDHPKAVSFYEAAGFTPYKTKENVEFEDYRYSTFYDLTDAPQIPLAGVSE